MLSVHRTGVSKLPNKQTKKHDSGHMRGDKHVEKFYMATSVSKFEIVTVPRHALAKLNTVTVA